VNSGFTTVDHEMIEILFPNHVEETFDIFHFKEARVAVKETESAFIDASPIYFEFDSPYSRHPSNLPI
jgi:hypothetical protein